jgi:hypothetical protein
MQSPLRPAHAVIAVLAAAVIGLGTVVAVDHTGASAPRAQTAPLSAAPGLAASLLASGPLAGSGRFKGEAAHMFDFFTTDTGLTWEQIGTDLLRGETLGQIAGTHAARVEADALNQVRAGLSLGVVKGAITAAQETRLVNDARDAISVLMAAKLNALLSAGR